MFRPWTFFYWDCDLSRPWRLTGLVDVCRRGRPVSERYTNPKECCTFGVPWRMYYRIWGRSYKVVCFPLSWRKRLDRNLQGINWRRCKVTNVRSVGLSFLPLYLGLRSAFLRGNVFSCTLPSITTSVGRFILDGVPSWSCVWVRLPRPLWQQLVIDARCPPILLIHSIMYVSRVLSLTV